MSDKPIRATDLVSTRGALSVVIWAQVLVMISALIGVFCGVQVVLDGGGTAGWGVGAAAVGAGAAVLGMLTYLRWRISQTVSGP